MARTFNIAGPCRPELHYMLPPESRLPDLAPLIEEQAWFVVHAPRQTGKTTAMRALAARLRAEPGTVAVWATLETSQGVESVEAAEPLWAVEGPARGHGGSGRHSWGPTCRARLG